MNELTLRACRRGLVAAGLATGLLTLSTAGASAAIACRGDVCWRVHTAYAYRPSPTIVIHPDYWRPPTPTIVIREHWRPVERFAREYIVRDYGGFDDPDW